MLLIGKPSISMGHGFHGYVSHNQRVFKYSGALCRRSQWIRERIGGASCRHDQLAAPNSSDILCRVHWEAWFTLFIVSALQQHNFSFCLPLTSSDPKQPIASVGIGSVSNNTCAMVTTWYMGYSHPLQNGSPYIHSNNYNRYIRGLIDHHPPISAARHFLKQGRPGIVGDMYKNHSGASFPKSTTDLGFWRSLRFGYTGHDQLVGYNPPHPTMSHYVPVLSQ